MLSNTLTIKWDGVDTVLVKVNQDNNSSEYRLRSSDSTNVYMYQAFIRHTSTKPDAKGVVLDRHNVEIRVTTSKIDGSAPANVRRIYAVLEGPATGVAQELIHLGDALGDLLKLDTFVTSLWNGES